MAEAEAAAKGPHRWPLALVGIMVGAFLTAVVVTASPGAEAGRAVRVVSLPPAVATPMAAPPAPAAPAPLTQEQDYLGEERCIACHAPEGETYHDSLHARAWDPGTPAAAQGCESCHGPGRAHFEDPEAPGLIRDFSEMSHADVSATCTTCHNGQDHMWWEGSAHDSRSMSCVSCHSMHGAGSEPLLLQASVTATCAQCHEDKTARVLRSSHMPVREGKMVCSTCHNPHGSANVRLLRAGNSINEACLSCHTEKRGPFLWEHPVVRESCVTCHEPHGSSIQNMLVARAPMLCQQCHTAAGHPSTVYDGGALDARSNRILARGCVNCHSNIHGSNHPAGARFMR